MLRLLSHLKPIRPYLTRLLLIVLIIGISLTPANAQAFSLTGGAVGAGLVGIGCAFLTATTVFGCIIAAGIAGIATTFAGDAIASSVIDFIVGIVNWVASLVITIILPMVVKLLIFSIGLNIQPLTDFQPVLDATQVVRDFANLVLVAILVIIAMATIVGIESYGVRKTLPLLIGVALIVNFSTVIVGVVIDSGNTVMRFFWESSGFNETPMDVYVLRNMNLSQAAAKGSEKEIINFLETTSTKGVAKTSSSLARASLYVVILLLALLAVYIFLRLALVFLIRVSAIWIILITAPIIFIIGAVPFGKSKMSEWWKELFNWAFLGPIVFFFLFFGLIIWSQINSFLDGGATVIKNAGGTNIAYAAGQRSGQDLRAFSLFFVFPVVAFFFMHALNASKKMAGNVANSLVDGAISVGKGVLFGGLALGAGAAVAGIGGNLLRSAGTKKMYERLQQSKFRPFQKIGSRLEGAHRQAVEKETQKAQGTYSGLDALPTGENSFDATTGKYTEGILGRWDKLNARQKVAAAGILMERKQALPDNIAREALTLAPNIDKNVYSKLKRQAPNIQFASAKSEHATTGGIDVAKLYNYASTNNIRGIEYSPDALKNAAVAGTISYAQLTEIARRGTQEQLAGALEGMRILIKNDGDIQDKVAEALGKQGGLSNDNLKEFIAGYKKSVDTLKTKMGEEPLFRVGRLGEIWKPTESINSPSS